MMWQEYNREQDPFKRVQILKDIAQVQPYLSAYYEATKYVVDKRHDNGGITRERAILNLNQKKNTTFNPIDGKQNQECKNNLGKSIRETEEKLEDEEIFKKLKEGFVF